MSQLELATPAEEEQFRAQGFMLLKSVFAPPEVEALRAEVDRLVVEATRTGAVLRESYYHEGSYKLVRALRLSAAFDPLIDHPGYFGKLVSLIGTHIQLMGTELFVRGPAREHITGFHTDLGAGLQQVLPDGRNPFLQIKTQIFLTDLSRPDSGNFALVPGSHRVRVATPHPLCMVDTLNQQIGADGQLPADAVQILAAPGDVILFPHTLWHAVGPNHSGRTRYSISFRYGQLALRPLERFDPVLTDPGRVLTPRQRRVLGDLGTDNPGVYRPARQDDLILGRDHSAPSTGVAQGDPGV